MKTTSINKGSYYEIARIRYEQTWDVRWVTNKFLSIDRNSWRTMKTTSINKGSYYEIARIRYEQTFQLFTLGSSALEAFILTLDGLESDNQTLLTFTIVAAQEGTHANILFVLFSVKDNLVVLLYSCVYTIQLGHDLNFFRV